MLDSGFIESILQWAKGAEKDKAKDGFDKIEKEMKHDDAGILWFLSTFVIP